MHNFNSNIDQIRIILMSMQLRDVAPVCDNVDVMPELIRARRLKSFLRNCKFHVLLQ